MFTQLYNLNTAVNENRFLYMSPDKEPGVWNGIVEVWNGGGKLLGAAGDLVGAVAGVTSTAAGVVTKSIDYVAKKTGDVIEWIENPGEPNSKLPIYKELKKVIPKRPKKLSSAMANEALNCHARVAFLRYKIVQAEKFQKIALNDYARAENLINTVIRKRELAKKQIGSLRSEIAALSAEINSGKYSEVNDRVKLALLRQERTSKNHQLLQLVNDDDFIVEWNVPQLQNFNTPYDASGGGIEPRYIRGKKKVKVDVRRLHKYLGVYFAGFQVRLEQYQLEQKKWAYRKEKTLSYVSDSSSWWKLGLGTSDKEAYTAAVNDINAQVETAIKAIAFTPAKGAVAKDIEHLKVNSNAPVAPKVATEDMEALGNEL